MQIPTQYLTLFKKYVIIYCLTETKEESPEYSVTLIIAISEGVLLFVIIVIGMICCVKYGKLRKVPCCSVSWGREKRTLERHDAEIGNLLIQQGQGGATNDTGKEESHEMISPSKQ